MFFSLAAVFQTGSTGEEYTLCGECAVALDTDSPDEIVSQVLDLDSDPFRAGVMRQAGAALLQSIGH